MSAIPLIAQAGEVTPEWITLVLHGCSRLGASSKVIAAEGRPIGTGQVGDSFRFRLRYDGQPGPASVVCKFAAQDESSARAGMNSGTYEREVAFYRDLAPTVEVSAPYCYFAGIEAGTARMILVLEDVAPAEQGDQIGGASAAQVEDMVDQAARLHGPRWGDERLRQIEWLSRDRRAWVWPALPKMWAQFVEQYDGRLDPVTARQGQCLMDCREALGRPGVGPLSPIHGDLRLDNVMFHPAGSVRPLTVLDWQTIRLGPGLEDLAYLIGTSFASVEDRRMLERDLLARYHAAIRRYGVASDYAMEDCWTDYRRQAFSGLIMAVLAATNVIRTERGDRMFLAMASRSAHMTHDLETAALLAP